MEKYSKILEMHNMIIGCVSSDKFTEVIMLMAHTGCVHHHGDTIIGTLCMLSMIDIRLWVVEALKLSFMELVSIVTGLWLMIKKPGARIRVLDIHVLLE